MTYRSATFGTETNSTSPMFAEINHHGGKTVVEDLIIIFFNSIELDDCSLQLIVTLTMIPSYSLLQFLYI